MGHNVQIDNYKGCDPVTLTAAIDIGNNQMTLLRI